MIVKEEQQFYTADDLWELSHDPDRRHSRYELSGGLLIEMAPAGSNHGRLALRIGHKVLDYIETDDYAIGEATGAETGFILGKTAAGHDVVRAPDVGFIARARVPASGLPDGYFPGAPDLAIEVVSPNDRPYEIDQKLGEYLHFGTRLIWFIYPSTQIVYVYTPGATRRLTADDTLDGGDVLPGFALPVRALFE
ncbi:MAG: Uma2 family endonuclease [Chloroflexota bacterium]|nr:Uma2 family endonuclease [Chloroflexota bacterium]